MSIRSSGLIDSPSSISEAQAARNSSTVATDDPRLIRLMKSLYQADQQVEYLHLQAEVESLLRQLQILKKQRLDSVKSDASLEGQ